MVRDQFNDMFCNFSQSRVYKMVYNLNLSNIKVLRSQTQNMTKFVANIKDGDKSVTATSI